MNIHSKHASFLLIVSLIFLVLLACSVSIPKSATPTSESLPGATEVANIPTLAPTKTLIPTPAPSPTPTLPPPPVAVIVPRLYTIDITQGGDVPTDLQEYVFNYPSGAGGSGPCEEGGTPMWETSYAGTVVPAVPRLMVWEIENISNTPEPQAILTLPDGSELVLEVRVYRAGCADISFEIIPGTMLGDYSIEFAQGNLSIVDTFSLEMPTDPVRVVYDGNEWFAGFEPNEHVTLRLYYLGTLMEFLQPEIAPLFPGLPDYSNFFESHDLEYYTLNAFLGQQTVMADEYGTFQVQYTSEQLPLRDDTLLLGIGDESRITTVAQGEISGTTYINQLSGSCNGSLPTRLKNGDTAVVTEYGEQTGFFANDSMVHFESGTTVIMVMGPFCQVPFREIGRGWWMWFIDAPGYPSLQVDECNAEEYYLEPVEP